MTRAATIFNGTYTIKSPTGSHRTLRIETEVWDSDEKRVLSVLTGQGPTRFAFVSDRGIHVWKRFGGGSSAGDYPKAGSLEQKLAWLLWELAANGGRRWPALEMDMLLEGTCIRCNRTLTTPESIDAGIGPVCAQKE